MIFYEAIYRCIDSLSRGYNVPKLLDVAGDRIEIHSLIKSYSENIVLYAVRKNQNAREIVETFYNDACRWVESQTTLDSSLDIGY